MIGKRHPSLLLVNMKWAPSTLTHVRFKLRIPELENQPHFLLLLYFLLRSETSVIGETISRPVRHEFHGLVFQWSGHTGFFKWNMVVTDHYFTFTQIFLWTFPIKFLGEQEQCETVLVPSKSKALQNKMYTSLVSPLNWKEVADCKNETQHS